MAGFLILLGTGIAHCSANSPLHNNASPAQVATGGRSPVYVILWFDTEDFVLPQSDDSAKRIAEFLTQQGIHATFKVVGEKARVLDRRGRKDVIAALDKHEIGYHSNYHSWHVTVGEYEEPLDWDDGVKEFIRREKPGFDDIRRIFGKTPTCFGQPGYSWAPEIQPAVKKMGINVYLDDGEQVGLNGQPFWYGGILNIYDIKYINDLRPNDDWSNLSQTEAAFKTAYSQFSESGGGIISIYFHPCEFVHRQFWDAVNFAHGADPPRSQWKLPPVKTPAERDKAFQFLENFVKYMKSYPVHFVTASGAFTLYHDNAQGRTFSKRELADIARAVNPAVSFQVHKSYTLSASEVLWLLNDYVADNIRNHPDKPIVLHGTPLGPSSNPADLSFDSGSQIPWSQFSYAVLDMHDFLAKNSKIPTVVWIGRKPYSPASYLVALAQVAIEMLDKKQTPQMVFLAPAHLEAAKYVAKNSPKIWGDWPIFGPQFNGRHIMELASLQAWTLKPAQLANSHHGAGVLSSRN